MNTSTQILVIGGGPAGSTASVLLAREGFNVTLVDKAQFPRYHVGESLLPICQDVFALLGVKEDMAACGFPKKYGSYFEWGDEQWEIRFLNTQGESIYGYQVEREEFDQVLLKNAKRQGVQVFEGIQIQELMFKEDRPYKASWTQTTGNEKGEISFDYVIDASGRSGIMAQHYLKSRRYSEAFQNVAVWGYWRDPKNVAKGPEGSIAIISTPEGWFWGIPQRNNIVSIGLVIHKAAFQAKKKQAVTLEQLYVEAIRECPTMAEMIAPATLISSIKAEQDYSYSTEVFSGPGYFIAGDSACFLDPLISTGIHLAMFSATLAAASLSSILRGEIDQDTARSFYNHSYQRMYLRFLVLVSSLYQQYRGKSSYFWDAQRLAQNDYDAAELSHAFMNIISGLEDLKDAEYGASERILAESADLYKTCIDLVQKRYEFPSMSQEERDEAFRRIRQFNRIQERPSLTQATATDGLYVVFQPRLGIVRAEGNNTLS